MFDLARNKRTCVRFDRHALYLGTPGREERCPAHAIGRTDAILISPLHRGVTAAGLHIDGNAISFSVPSAGVEVTATWSRTPRLVSEALGRKSLPGTSHGVAPAPTRGAASTGAEQAARSAAVYIGLGFDTCSAPSTSQMHAWSSSPYRAVNVHVGGINAACAQPNLTKNWLAHELASGWHLIPAYVGLQAPTNLCGCRSMSSSRTKAKSQGKAAARDAVARAKLLGIGVGNPIYNDLEGYATGTVNTRAVLAFLAGWTAQLHAAGYLSGVYSSASSGIRDLVHRYGTRYLEPDDIWIADWNGVRSTRDRFVPAEDWPHHRRQHQYAGNRTERYGGVTLNVDDDYVNGATANAPGR